MSNSMKKLLTPTLSIAMLMATPVMMGLPSASAVAKASTNHNPSAAKNLNALLSNVKSMTANFNQSTVGGKNNRNFSGTMAVQRPNNFRWQIDGSASQLVVANGSRLWIYDKDLNQATRQSVNSQVGDTPALLLSGNPSTISANFNVTQPTAGKNYYVLYPKNNNGSFKSLGIAFNSGNPVMMVLNDNLGQVTTIKYSNIKRNTSIPSSQFSFTPPKGVDVIEQ
ncbi:MULTISPECIES: outer membrane lipoprotein chaperone LolA [unclassified Moraxella]|uniref:outer membrane lipoprotein chaperone LolA n=1 Tax=unclassified Moraxella TaxID=2685852 RepID=UPI003AF9DDEA